MKVARDKARILIVEDEVLVAAALESYLKGLGYTVFGKVTAAEEALSLMVRDRPDLVLMDVLLAGPMDGIEAAEIIRDRWGTPVVFLTALADTTRIDRAKMVRPFGCVVKPFQEKALKITLDMALYVARVEGEHKRAEQALQAERNNLQAVLAASPVGMLVFNADREVVLANPAAESLFHTRLEDLNHPRCGDFISCPNREIDSGGCGRSPDCPACPLFSVLENVLQGRIDADERQGETLLATGAWAEPIWINYRVNPVMLEGRRGAILAVDDISRQKLAEEALKESDANYSMVVNSLQETLSVIDTQGTILFVNDQAARNLSSGRPADTIGRNIDDFVPSDQALKLIDGYRRTVAAGELRQQEVLVSMKSGDRWFSNVLQPVKYGREKTPAVLSLSMDITERKRAEEELRRNEEQFRLVVENVREVFWIRDLDRERIDYVNPAYEEVWGRSCGSLYEHPGSFMDSVHPEDLLEVNRRFRGLREQGQPFNLEYRILTGDNQVKWVWVRANTVLSEDGRRRVVGIAEETTERKKVEESLRASEKRFRTLATGNIDGIMVVDESGGICFANPAAEELFRLGAPRLHGNVFGLPFASEDWSEVAISTPRGLALNIETRSSAIEWEGRPAHLVSIRDVTERVRAEEGRLELENRVQNSQRLEAIGVLAGGIAHDFNNILSAIMGYTELALMDIAEDAPFRHILKQIVKAGLRGRDLIQQILSFSRRTEQKVTPLHLSHVVKESIKFMRASLPTTIDLKYNIHPDEDAVMVDPTQIHQVLMNLGANAAYAMRESGGRLEISMRRLDVSDEMAAACLDLTAGRYQELIVSDTGGGIESGIIDRIFDPFFTTKPLGEGTGLGLSTTHGIVRSHGGAIRVSSEVGLGTTFRIYLPCVQGAVAAGTAEPAMPSATGTERILFVDDEESLVDVGRKVMGRLGYVVTGAGSGAEALELFRQGPDQFDLVMTDQTMPGLTGVELAREILRDRPEMPIILFTGYSQKVDQNEAVAMGIKRFLLKPFVLQEIVQAVRELLDAGKKPTD
jgi:PAS domain S-box-containing protein